MTNLIIGSFNTKDNAINRNGGIREDGTDNAKILAQKIKEKNFDILGTQELTIKYTTRLKQLLPHYKFCGDYRYGNMLINMPYNENNQIITKQNILDTQTIWLPFVAHNLKDLKTSISKTSIMPRIATIAITENNDGQKICTINTHLDYQVPSIQIRQLKALSKIVRTYSAQYPIILTGDFNMELKEEHFNDFVHSMEKENIKRVEISKNTWYPKEGNGKTEDHIFIPKNWIVEDCGVIQDEEMGELSDHKAIYVKTITK